MVAARRAFSLCAPWLKASWAARICRGTQPARRATQRRRGRAPGIRRRACPMRAIPLCGLEARPEIEGEGIDVCPCHSVSERLRRRAEGLHVLRGGTYLREFQQTDLDHGGAHGIPGDPPLDRAVEAIAEQL